jgi:hypothetical protein
LAVVHLLGYRTTFRKKSLFAIDMQKGTGKFTLQMLSNEDHQQQDGEWQGLLNPPC